MASRLLGGKVRYFSTLGFDGLGLSPALVNAVKELNFTAPTTIQSKAAELILGGKQNVALASETGSGKTLGFLLPIVELLKREEVSAREKIDFKEPLPGRPKVLVLAPSRELSSQIGAVAKTLAHHAKFRSLVVTGRSGKVFRRLKEGSVDIVIGTPSKIVELWRADRLFLGQVKHLVIDEADVVLGRTGGMLQDVEKFMPRLLGKNMLTCVFAGASVIVPWKDFGRDMSGSALKTMHKLVEKNGDGEVNVAESDNPEKLARGVQVKFVQSAAYNKHPSLIEAVSPYTNARTIVFCNSVSSCRSTAYFLDEHFGADVFVGCLHGEMRPKLRDEYWKRFQAASSITPMEKPCVLVCTDIAARGLDFNKSIDHVVLYDLPSNMTDFLHRCGRTARGGAKGIVTAIVGKGRHEAGLKAKIEIATKLGKPNIATGDQGLFRKRSHLSSRKRSEPRNISY